nr:xylulose kinase-1 [Tanacetum cinerariifolium]
MVDAKDMWEAIKSKFGGNDESKKMQKYLRKQQFEGFSVSSSEGLHKSRRRDGGYNGNKARYNSRRPASQDDSKALVTIDGEAVDCRLLNTQMSANDKFGLGYGDYRYGSILSYENEVLQSVFMNKECDLENTPVNDRYAKRMHTVPPLMTGNYMPSGPDVEIDYSKFTYGPKQTSADESDSKPIEYASSNSDSRVEPYTSVPKPVVNESNVISEHKAVCEPKVWTDAPIIKEYESNSDDDLVFNVQENIEKPSFIFTNSVKHVKSPRENVKETCTPNHYPKIEKQHRHSHTKKGLGYARKPCFVCGSFSHLIRDCDFHEKRMAKQAALTKSKEKVLTKTDKIPVNAARQNFSRQVALTSTASKVNTARPFDDPHKAFKDKGIVDSGCSRHMAGNKAHFTDYQEFKGGSVAFEGSNGRITGKEKIKAGRLKRIKREYSNARTPQQNRVDERKNRVLVTKPKNKTPYELLTGR